MAPKNNIAKGINKILKKQARLVHQLRYEPTNDESSYNDSIFYVYMKYLILCNSTILPLPMVSWWYFFSVGMIDMIPSVFQCDLCEIVVVMAWKAL